MFTPNPKLYRELSKPFPTVAASEEALEGFYNELGALREKYKFADVECILMFPVADSDSDGDGEGQRMTSLHFGNPQNSEMMLSWALGRAQVERQELTARLLAAFSHKKNK